MSNSPGGALPSRETHVPISRPSLLLQDLEKLLPHGRIRVEETREGDRWLIRAHLPGLDRHSVVDLSLDGWVLSLDVARHTSPSSIGSGLHQLHQIVSVPVGTRLQEIDSSYRDGILTLSMPVVPHPPAVRSTADPRPGSTRSRVSITHPTFDRPTPSGDRVVVGVDGTPASLAALRWALPLVGQEACPLEIVAAWTNPTQTASRQVPGHVNEERERAAAVAAEAAAVAREGLPAATAVVSTVAMGDPAEVLVERAAGARFLVLGSPRVLGRPGVPGACQARVHCPVFVVLPHDEDRGGGSA